ncbi:RNA-binding protein Nop12 [Rhizophagus clarus]|uniref:Nucleolar protein 12 n=1 Tax=Rhizophagus clarus TaxID=94130 RepID=A0A8H3ME75_9GLOM|nr:RNA-binding protein Nop12 [Rhizophagus clarus]
MSDYTPGSLQQTILGSKSSEINNDLDALFKNSAGPAQISKEVSINFIEDKIKILSVENYEPVLRKKKHSLKNANHGCHLEDVREEASHDKKLESKNKFIEGNYEIKVMKKEIKSTNKIDENNLNCEKHIKRKRSARDLKSQKRTKVIKDIASDEFNSDEKKSRSEDTNIQQVESKISTKDSKTMNIEDNDQHKNGLLNVINKDEPERLQRTIFVGNLPVSVIQKVNHKKLKALFSQFGKIESLRFRSIAFSELLPRKLAFIKGKFHPERDVLNAYIVYKESSSVQQAIAMNAQVFLGKHLRVDSVASPQNQDRRRTVFIGSLAFDAQEEELWLYFKSCGEIENVRIVRDSKTNVGKGFAFVQFKERASVELALKLNDTKLGPRKIRVTRCAKGNHVVNIIKKVNQSKTQGIHVRKKSS